MNKRQKAFALEYAVDGNGSAAAVRAGYSVTRSRQTASELLKRPDVVAELARLSATIVEGDGPVTREWVLLEMLDYHVRGKRGEVPASVAIRGLENYAKMTGVLVERSVSVSTSTEVKVWTLAFDRELEPPAE